MEDAKACIKKNLKEEAGCSGDQQTALLAPLDPLVTVPCGSRSAETTSTAATAAPTTATPASQTTKARSSASQVNINLLAGLLPILLLVFKLI